MLCVTQDIGAFPQCYHSVTERSGGDEGQRWQACLLTAAFANVGQVTKGAGVTATEQRAIHPSPCCLPFSLTLLRHFCKRFSVLGC